MTVPIVPIVPHRLNRLIYAALRGTAPSRTIVPTIVPAIVPIVPSRWGDGPGDGSGDG
jgi:hypothetical protein